MVTVIAVVVFSVTGAEIKWLPMLSMMVELLLPPSMTSFPPAPAASVYEWVLLNATVPTDHASSSVMVEDAVMALPNSALAPANWGILPLLHFPGVAQLPPPAPVHVPAISRVESMKLVESLTDVRV